MNPTLLTLILEQTCQRALLDDLHRDWLRQSWNGTACSLKSDLSVDATEMVVDRATWNDGGTWVPSIVNAAAGNSMAMYAQYSATAISERPANPTGFTVGCSVVIGRSEPARVVRMSDPDAETGAVTVGLSRGQEQKSADDVTVELPFAEKAQWPAGTNVSLLHYATPYEYVSTAAVMTFLNSIVTAYGVNSAVFKSSVTGRMKS